MPRFPRTSSSMLSFPAFTGATRLLVLANAFIFFFLLLLNLAAPHLVAVIEAIFALTPRLVVGGWVWQLVSYSFLNSGVLHTALNLLTLWFIGSYLEADRGERWLLQAYFVSVIGGALLGSALCFTHVLGSTPASLTAGMDAPIFGLLAAFAVLFGDLEMYMFPLPLAIKSKYLVIIYMLVEVAFLLSGGPPLAYFTILAAALAGLIFARTQGRRTRRKSPMALTESYYALRNSFYRWRRRRTARKFEVYMRGQNRDVHFDNEGRYIAPEEEPNSQKPRNPQNPNDRRWMN